MLKIALVGVGGISGAHIPAWDEMENAELVALCDIRPERMEQYENKKHYTDFDEMLDNEEIDILDICLPTYLHAEYAIKAMERGIHVISEKPISMNADDIDRVYETAKKNNVKFMVAQVLRFWPEYELLKEIDLDSLSRGIRICFTNDEEKGFSGIKELIGKKIDFCEYSIIGEPTDNYPCIGSKGLLEYELTFKGTAVHSSIPIENESSNENTILFLKYKYFCKKYSIERAIMV